MVKYMNDAGFFPHRNKKEQRRLFELGAAITDTMSGQVVAPKQGSSFRQSFWRGVLDVAPDELSDDGPLVVVPERRVAVGYLALYSPDKVDEDIVINEEGPEESTLEITYARGWINTIGSTKVSSIYQTLEAQAGFEVRRTTIADREAELLQLTHDTLIKRFGQPVTRDEHVDGN